LFGPLALVVAAGCASLDLSPSSVETWSGPPFPAERVATIDILPVADVRTIGRGASVMTATLTREAAASLLRERGYATSASGDALAATARRMSAAEVLEVTAVTDRCACSDGFVLAIAVEQTSPDIGVAPATVRVALRGVIVDVADRVVVWSGASVAETGSLSRAIATSPSAALHAAIHQAMRALLADLPMRPSAASSSGPNPEAAASGSAHPRRAIDGGVRRRGEGGFAAGRGAEVRG
jgi:hypothetical protein